MFKLEFSTENAAFTDGILINRDIEIGRILNEIADTIVREGRTLGAARDINGNKVGEWEIT